MIAMLFKIKALAFCPVLGLFFITFSCYYFFAMLLYAIIAECYNFPMPLDSNYLMGKINMIIFEGSLIIGVFLFFL